MRKIIITVTVIFVALIAGMFIIDLSDNDGDVTEKSTKVGLVLNGYKDDKSWSQSHYEGLMKTAEQLDLEIICKEYVTTDTIASEIEDMVNNDCEIIIANSDLFREYVLQAAEHYPEIYFFHASGTASGKNLCSYFGRMYQARYLSGIAAGLQTKTNSIGYVAAFPISEVNRGINAFALGVRSVNPEADVYVRWTNSWTGDMPGEEAAEQLIAERNIDVITVHTDSIAPLQVAERHGISAIGYNVDNSSDYPRSYLTAAVWDWEKFYTPRIFSCLSDKFIGDNFWEGIDSGIISLAPISDNANSRIAEKVKTEYDRLVSGGYDVFYGPICDNEGVLRVAEGECMTDQTMLNEFDWYVEGVVIEED